jgi:hypothetical protein
MLLRRSTERGELSRFIKKDKDEMEFAVRRGYQQLVGALKAQRRTDLRAEHDIPALVDPQVSPTDAPSF